MANIYLYREFFSFGSFLRASVEKPTDKENSAVEIIGVQEIELPDGYKLSKNGKHIIEQRTGVVVPVVFINVEHLGEIRTCFDCGDYRYCVAAWKKNGKPTSI